MTDRILKTSVFEKNGVTFVAEPVDLSQVVDQVVASLKLLVEQKNGSVNVTTNGGPHVISGSLTHLTNVVYNLVDNAIKYCPENPSIKIVLEHKDQGTTLAVADNGIGIPSEYQDKVFEKFFRVPTGDIHDAKGYGLGLSYVASVVKSHGGKITLNSSSRGTTFSLLFPQ
jgi:signal transduction histidine kinase